MRHATTALFTLASVLMLQSSSEAQFKGGKSFASGWLPSLQDGKLQAQKTGKPLMVVLRCVP
jgi:hypothetical protein